MKTKRKFSAVLVTLVVTFVMLFAFVLALGLRVNADAEATGNGEFELTDSPSEKLDLLSGYAVRFASADSLSADSAAASEIANMISAQGSYVASLPDIASSAQAREILIGTTNRDESSAFYQELLDARDNEDDLVWGYYVVGTKVLFTANCTDAFNYGFADFVAYLEICSFKPTVGTKSVGVMTRADYDVMIEADAEAQKAKRIEELKEKIAKFSNTDFTNGEYMTPEFTKMPESDIWGTPLHYPTEGQHPRVNITPDTLKSIKNYITTTDEGKYLYEAMVEFAKREFTGELPDAYMHETGRIGWHNVDETGLAIIEARAFVYLVSGDAEYGYSAVLAMKNYLKTFELGWIHSDQCREFGRTMFVTAEIYDWCYDLLTAKDKEQFIVACTYIASGSADTRYGGKYAGLCQSGNAYMEVGYPPSEQGSVAGHGAEAQILRDYLSISIAMFDENPTWYNYVAARLYNDFIEFRNYYFRAGMYPQGIFNYAPHRHSSDVWSAWLFYCATGENPYSDDLNRIANGFIEQMAPDGSYFGTGDGTRPASTQAYSMYIFTICAALYGDSGLRDAVLDYYGKDSLEGIKTGAQTTFSTVHHIIFGAAYYQKTGTTEAVEWNEGKDPVSYHSYPIGQMIARAEWNNPNAPAAFMLIAEKSTSNHEHADAGTFQLFYKGLYSGESGVYDKYGSDHWRYYHQSTVAHNGLLIFDPNGVEAEPVYDATGKLTNAAKVYYSGGQRHFFGAGDTLDEWLNATDTVTGTVTGHEYGLNADGSADYAYLAGDISASYLLSQASYVGRNMLTLFTGDEKYPMYFIVYDSIDTASETLVNKFLLHSPTDPDIDDTAKRVTITKDDARLVLTALKGADKIEKLGGNNDPTKWEEDDKNYLINGVQCGSTKNDDDMWGRVELSSTGKTNAEFFNVIYFTDADNDEAESFEIFDEDAFIGTKVGSTFVIFAKSPDRTSEQLNITTEGTGCSRYIVTGLYAGTWDVDVDGVTVAHCTATEEGGMISFYAPAGEVHIKPGKDIAPSNGGRIIYNTYGGIVPDDAPTTYIVDEPFKLPLEVVRGRDQFLGWYTSPTFEEETRVEGEFYPFEKGRLNFYAKYRAFYLYEDYQDFRDGYVVENQNAVVNYITYIAQKKPGSVFTLMSNSSTGNKYMCITRESKDLQIDSGRVPSSYMSYGETKLTFEVDLALNGAKKPMTSSFFLREGALDQRVLVFGVNVSGDIYLGKASNVIMSLSSVFQKVIVTVDFGNSLITAYDISGDVLKEVELTLPSKDGVITTTATTTLEWLGLLGQTFNWWMGGGESILVDNFRVYGGDFVPEDYELPAGANQIVYHVGTGYIYPDSPSYYTAGNPVTLPSAIATGEKETFEGWYTTPKFEEGTKLNGNVLLSENADAPIHVYAKYVMPAGMNKIDYNIGMATLPEDAPKFFYTGVDAILPTTLQLENGTFCGWYTTPTFEEGTEITVINTENTDTAFSVYAKIETVFFDEDFTESVIDNNRAESETELGISYGLADKTGTHVKAVTDAAGNKYIRVFTDEKDATINYNNKDIAKIVKGGGGKLTYEVSLSTLEDGRSGDTTFRARSSEGGATNSVNIFTTSDGKIYLNGSTELEVGELTGKLTKYAFTLNIYTGDLVAYDEYGFELASTVVGVPANSPVAYDSLADWFDNVTYAFNWQMSAGGAICYDDIKIYTGDFETEKDVPDNSNRLVLKVGNGELAELVPYYTADVALTLPTPTALGEHEVFAGWYRNPDFTGEAVTVLNEADASAAIVLYAKYELEESVNRVEYSGTNGTLPSDAPMFYEENKELTLPVLPNNEYESFVGWYRNPDFTGDVVTVLNEADASAPITLYAKWELVEGTNRINYELSGGTLPEGAPLYYKAGEALTLPIPTLTYEKFKTVFVGWYRTPDFKGAPVTVINEATADSEITLYAYFNIIFIDQDFTDSEAKIEAGNGTAAADTDNKSFDGIYYQFKGKYAGMSVKKDAAGNAYIHIYTDATNAADGTTSGCDPLSEVTDSNKLNKSAVMANGGKLTYEFDLAVPADGKIGASTLRLRASGTWDVVPVFRINASGEVHMNSTKHIATLTSQFTRVIITLDVLNETITAYNEYGEVIESDALVIPDSGDGGRNAGKFESFKDWFLTTGSTYQWYFERGGGIAYDNIKIYAGEYKDYVRMPESSNKLSFVLNGGAVASELPVYYTAGEALLLPTPVTGLDTKVFKGWYRDAELTDGPIFTLNEQGADESITLYAKYGLPKGTNELDFSVVGGTVAGDTSEIYKAGEKITLPDVTPTASDEIFHGWYLDAAFMDGPYIGEYTPDNADAPLTFYAKVGLPEGVGRLDYVLGDGTVSETLEKYYTVGEAIALPTPTPPSTYEKFAGWYLDADFTDGPVTELVPENAKAPITLYAKFEVDDGVGKIVYNNLNGGILPTDAPMYYRSGEKIVLPIPTLDGATFFGWYTTETFIKGTSVTEIDKAEADGAVVLYARFIKVTSLFDKDFESSELAGEPDSTYSNDGATITNKFFDGISYGFNTKSCFATLNETADGNKYIHLYTNDNNPSGGTNNCDPTLAASHNTFKTQTVTDGGRITFSVDMATHEDGRVGSTTFRLRENTTGNKPTDVIVIFKTDASGNVLLGGMTDKVIGKLDNTLTKYVFTLDIYEETLTAYDMYGDIIDEITVSVPATTKTGIVPGSEGSVAEWFEQVGNIFQWFFSGQGGLNYDNLSIHTGDYYIPQ